MSFYRTTTFKAYKYTFRIFEIYSTTFYFLSMKSNFRFQSIPLNREIDKKKSVNINSNINIHFWSINIGSPRNFNAGFCL